MHAEQATEGFGRRWRYAPLFAWAVSSLWICLPLLSEVWWRGFPNYLPRGSYVLQVIEMFLGMILLLAVVNWAFVALFLVVVDRDRALNAPSDPSVQGSSVGSVRSAMWCSLGAMMIPAGLLMLLTYYMEHFGPQGRGSGIGAGITIMAFLALQFLVQPILGLIGWFAGRSSYRIYRQHRSGLRGIGAGPAR